MTAIISPCGAYRYRLERVIADQGRVASVIMVNPSTADATENDATIRKLIGFGQRLGWSKVIVGNLFAYRATDVNELAQCDDPGGPLNAGHLLRIMIDSEITIVAWGASGKLPPQLRQAWRSVVALARALNRPLQCWGRCNDGQPRHPVMLGYGEWLIEWEQPK